MKRNCLCAQFPSCWLLSCVWVCLHLPVQLFRRREPRSWSLRRWTTAQYPPKLPPAEFTQAEDASPYQATDVVRVSILLDGKSTLEAGYSTLGIAENASAMSYRRNLARRQEAMVDAISAEALEGSHWMWCGT